MSVRDCNEPQQLRTQASPQSRSVACKLLDVGDVVPRVAVEGLLQPQLVEVMPYEAGGPAEHKQAVQTPEGHQIIALLAREGPAGADHVDEGNGYAPINIEDEIGALSRGQMLHRQSKVQDWGALEVGLGVVPDKAH